MAILRNAVAQGTAATASSFTWNHIVSGSSRVIDIWVEQQTASNQVTLVQYAGVTAAIVGTATVATNRTLALYRLFNPTTGTNAVLVTLSASTVCDLVASVSYTGVDPAVANQFISNSASAVSTISASLTPTNSNSWMVAFSGGDRAPTGWTGATAIAGLLAGNGFEVADSNGAVTGAQTITHTQDAGANMVIIVSALSPQVLPELTTSAVSSIDLTTATGNGEVISDNGSVITARGMVWNTSTAPTLANSNASTTGTVGTYSVAMTGLTANTLYYVRSYATNANGTSYGNEVTFTTLAAQANQITKDISGVTDAEYAVSIDVGGTLGSVTVKLGTTGTTATFNAGTGVNTFSGTYGGLSGLIIEMSATFNGYIDNVYYVRKRGTATIDWSLSTLTNLFSIPAEVLFRRIEDKQFNHSRTYRYLDLMFKNLNAYITTTIRQEQSDVITDKTKTYLVTGSGAATKSPFIKKRVSFLSKNQAILIGLSSNTLNSTFTIARFALSGFEQPDKQFSPSKIISIT